MRSVLERGEGLKVAVEIDRRDRFGREVSACGLDRALQAEDVENLVAGVVQGESERDHGRSLAGYFDRDHVIERARGLRLRAFHKRRNQDHDQDRANCDQHDFGGRKIFLGRAVLFADVDRRPGGSGWRCGLRTRRRCGSRIGHGKGPCRFYACAENRSEERLPDKCGRFPEAVLCVLCGVSFASFAVKAFDRKIR